MDESTQSCHSSGDDTKHASHDIKKTRKMEEAELAPGVVIKQEYASEEDITSEGCSHFEFIVNTPTYKVNVDHNENLGQSSKDYNLAGEFRDIKQEALKVECDVSAEAIMCHDLKVKQEPNSDEGSLPSHSLSTLQQTDNDQGVERQTEMSYDEHSGLRCDQCERAFIDEDLLNCHKSLVHSEATPYKCSQPDNSSGNARKKAGKTSKCKECSRSFQSKRELLKHSKIHSSTHYKCVECDMIFHGSSGLATHVKNVHDEKPYACTMCDRAFANNASLISHMRLHTGDLFSCSECNRGFISKKTLTIHKRTHSGDKPFKCNDCGRAFAQKAYLARHAMNHSEVKPFKCDICSGMYASLRNLRNHIVIVHLSEKPFKCSDCDKTFFWKSALTNHEMIHAGEKRYKCDICNLSYMHKDGLVAHKREHTGDLFYCDQCDRSFNRQRHLVGHMRVHTREKPFKCSECDSSFAHSSNLNIHRKLHQKVT